MSSVDAVAAPVRRLTIARAISEYTSTFLTRATSLPCANAGPAAKKSDCIDGSALS